MSIYMYFIIFSFFIYTMIYSSHSIYQVNHLCHISITLYHAMPSLRAFEADSMMIETPPRQLGVAGYPLILLIIG